MDLIVWRHADAEQGGPDLERPLTKRGRKEAAGVAEWLLERLPEEFEVVASPAARAQQTAEALGRKIRTEARIAPGASPQDLIGAARWPDARGPVILVGHQPDLGNTLAYLVSGRKGDWRLRKGALWWIESGSPVLVRAAISPDLLED